MELFKPRPRDAKVSNPNAFTAAGKSMVAAGERVTRRKADESRRLIQPWQASAYAYYDLVPEIKYAASFYSRSLSVLRLYAAEKDANGEWVEIEDQNHEAVKLLNRVQDPGGERSGLLASYGRLIFLGGEAYLAVTTNSETGDEEWEMLSPDELRLTGSNYTRTRAPSLGMEQYRIPDDEEDSPGEGEMIVYRLWRRHPRFSKLADSTMHGVLDVCEELVLLTKAVRARARSRLAGAGILLVNGNVVPVPVEGDTADENPEEDPFVRDLVDAMTKPIADEGTPSAVVPLVVRVDVDKELGLDNVIKHVQIVDPTQLYPETGLRREAIDRLGIGLDMPPEVLTGMADANHWTGWQIDEQTWKGHLQPVAQQLVDDLTSSFFRPTLRDGGVKEYRNIAIRFDASEIINHPDRSKDAKDLYDKRAIGKRALRDANGFDDDDAPTQEELNEMIGVAVRDANLAINGEVSGAQDGGTDGTPDETVDDGSAPAETEKVPPEEPTQTDVRDENLAASVFSARIIGAADLALLRARELAGSRLRNLAKRDKEAAAKIDGIPTGRVPFVLGRAVARELRAGTERELVAGAGELILESLRLWRIDDHVATALATRIEQHAARTLFDEHPAPLPASIENYVREAAGAP